MELGYKMNKNGSVEKCKDMSEYASMFRNTAIAQRRLRGVFVSTVFLVIDHGYRTSENKDHYKPVLWETMIFGGKNDDYQKRYTSLEDSKVGHENAVQIVLDTEPRRMPRKKKKRNKKLNFWG